MTIEDKKNKWKRISSLVPLHFPHVVDQSKSKEKKNKKMKCQIFLCIALDHCSCFVHFQILTALTAVVMFCVSYLLCCPFRMRFHQCFNKVGLITISMGDARVQWLNIAC